MKRKIAFGDYRVKVGVKNFGVSLKTDDL